MRSLRKLIIIMLSVCMCWSFAGAGTLTSIDFQTRPEQTDIFIRMSGGHIVPDSVFTLPGERPRLVVDLDNASIAFNGMRPTRKGVGELTGAGLVDGVRYGDQGDGQFRLVFDLMPGATHASSSHESGGFKLTIKGASPELKVQPTMGLSPVKADPRHASASYDLPMPRVKPRVSPSPNLPLEHRAVKRKPVIVIDPGHGGRDPGAIGVAGTYEKKITLSAARELAQQLKQTGRYTVILTRNTDVYIDHDERLRRARIGQADLFISIHADATASASVQGASVYTLADRATRRSRKIVSNQNWIMDVDLSTQSDPVGDILIDLAQRKTKSQSTLFAGILVDNLEDVTRLVNNSHRRAGYYVLLAPDVPAVLLELGFLSNASDELLLLNAAHRKRLMQKVTTSITQYFDQR